MVFNSSVLLQCLLFVCLVFKKEVLLAAVVIEKDFLFSID